MRGGGNDTIHGTKAPDVIVAGGGNDRITGLGGNDRICGGPGDDTIDGGKGVDRIDGEAGDDSITGDKGPDTIAGGPGNDYVNGEKGSDDVDGGTGDDNLLGDKGNDSIEGGPGNDRIEGGPGDEKSLDGGEGTDTIYGGAGSDNITGGPGDGDIVSGDAGTDALDGGPGAQDIVSYSSATRGAVQINLAASTAKGDGHDSITGFEDVVGSPQGDDIVGDAGPNRLDGGVGDDNLDGGGGSDEAFGGPGTDSCHAFAAEHSCGPEVGAPPNAAFAVLNAGLDGASLVIQGGPGSDDLHVARSGDSWVVSDNSAIFPGDGCSNAGGPTAVSCPGSTALALIVITGGNGDDSIAIDPSIPPSAKVRINGNGGSDTLSGGPGDDVLEAGENYNSPDDGSDTLIGNGGSDVLYADPGPDQLSGGPGNDLLVSSVPVCQGHTYDGGPGDDTVSYARSNASLEVTLGGTGGPAGCGTPDHVLASNESLEGSDGPDVLVGDNKDNSFLGHLGADTFVGKGGSDFIDAVDGERDKRIDCGGGGDEVIKDRSDPGPISC